MKKFLWFLVVLFIAIPVLAQDEGGGGGLPSSLFGDSLGAPRGEQYNPMDAVKKFFAQSNVTFSSDQEKTLKPIIESAFKQVQDTVERLGGQPAGAQRGFRGQGQGGGERRGGGGGAAGGDGQRRGRGGPNGVNVETNPQLAAELRKINDDVLAKIVGVMKPDQKDSFKKWQDNEILKTSRYPGMKKLMDSAGASFSPEQETQVRALYLQEEEQRSVFRREGQGTVDPAKITELENGTTAKLVKLLTPAQRKALLDSRTKQ